MVRGMADTAKVGCVKLGHADELHVVLHCIVSTSQVCICGQSAHCGLAEGIQGCIEYADHLQAGTKCISRNDRVYDTDS